jgi:hypothetical protein
MIIDKSLIKAGESVLRVERKGVTTASPTSNLEWQTGRCRYKKKSISTGQSESEGFEGFTESSLRLLFKRCIYFW